MVSASSSFFRLILSLSVSASRRACWMRACIASGDTSLGCEFMATGSGVSGRKKGSRAAGEGDSLCTDCWRIRSSGGIELTNLGLWRAEGEEKKECAGLWGFGGKRTELSYSNVSSYPRGVGLAWLGPGCLGADDGKLTVGCQALSRG